MGPVVIPLKADVLGEAQKSALWVSTCDIMPTKPQATLGEAELQQKQSLHPGKASCPDKPPPLGNRGPGKSSSTPGHQGHDPQLAFTGNSPSAHASTHNRIILAQLGSEPGPPHPAVTRRKRRSRLPCQHHPTLWIHRR